MALNFPTSPSLDDTYSFGTKTWIWNGSAWQLNRTGAINDIPVGNITPASGAFTTLSATGNVTGSVFVANSGNVTISAAAGNNSVVLAATGTGVINASSVKIVNLADPTNPQDAATKVYVDDLVARGIHFHQPVRVESPINLVAAYDNGTDGVGATLTNSGTQEALVIDGITMVVADRVLVYEQTDQTENGVYVVTSIGSVSTNWILTRASDADTYEIDSPDGLSEGSTFFVQQGATGAGETYTCNTVGTIVFGTTNITFTQISSAQIYSAGTGLTLAGTTFSVNNTQSQITAVGTLSTLSVAGNVTSTYFLGNANIQYTAGSTEPTGNLIGAQWYNTSNDVLYEWQTDGTSNYWIDITGPVIGSNSAASGTTLTNGTSNISVALNSNATVNIGGTANVVVWSTAGEYVTGVVSATGNISGGNMIAAGAVYSNYNTNAANIGSFMATGGNTKGGTGYLDFLVAQNTSGGATNPYKWFRINPTGGLELINSAYSATVFSVSDAGNVNIPGQYQVNGKQAVNGPAFRAYIDGSQTITSGSQQKVTFGTETFDTNSNFASSRFTPTVEGYYQLNATVRIDGTSGTGEVMIILYKNGGEYARGTNEQGTEQGVNFYSMQVSDIAYANGSTDYFEIYIQQTSGSNRNTTAGTTISYFSGVMVRGA